MYAITGITGKVGGELARTLLAAGQVIRAIVRDAKKGEEWAALGCELALAEMEDASALTAAFAGATAVFILPPSEFDPEPGYPEAQAVINQRVIGMRVGDFFDRYGRPKLREAQADGTTEYAWISEITATPNSGYYGLDDRTCSMKIIAAKDGRIVTASIVQDMPGRTTTSRCLELFKPA